MKQETFEEFLEREGYDEGRTQEIWADGARRGAEWQAKQMYSKDELAQELSNKYTVRVKPKNPLIKIVYSIIVSLCIYGLFGFVIGNYDIPKWAWIIRFFYILVLIIPLVFVWGEPINKNEQEFNKNEQEL